MGADLAMSARVSDPDVAKAALGALNAPNAAFATSVGGQPTMWMALARTGGRGRPAAAA